MTRMYCWPRFALGAARGIKILEAMATGFTGDNDEDWRVRACGFDRKEILIADGADSTVRALTEIFTDDTLRLSRSARAKWQRNGIRVIVWQNN